jgi:hypothetical protein
MGLGARAGVRMDKRGVRHLRFSGVRYMNKTGA